MPLASRLGRASRRSAFENARGELVRVEEHLLSSQGMVRELWRQYALLEAEDRRTLAQRAATMTRKPELEAAKERKRAYLRAYYYARRYATDPEYRARMQAHTRKKLAEIRANPKRHAAYKKKMREYLRTLPSRKLSQQRAYAKLAANPEWRERHNAKQRERYHSDPAFRVRARARARLYSARRKTLRTRGKGQAPTAPRRK
jgi:hypothetical protein